MRSRPRFEPSIGALALAAGAVLGAALTAAWVARRRQPIGNLDVPEPARSVDLRRYAGRWYELGRYDYRYERDLEAVTADYRLLDGGGVEVVNAGRVGGPDGRLKTARGRAKVVKGSGGAKLKVSFFGPFFADYWVLDHAEDYSWSIVGEPSGRYLWLLSRTPEPAMAVIATLQARVRELGYDKTLIRPTAH